MWTLDAARGVARLELPSLTATVDLLHPTRGLRLERLDGGPPLLDKSFLGLDLGFSTESPESAESTGGLRPTEAFVRGGDLVAYYPANPKRLVPQLYWRVVEGAGAGAGQGIELIVSMQTDLLDNCPEWSAVSELGTGRLWTACGGGTRFEPVEPVASGATRVLPVPDAIRLVRWPGSSVSYVELVQAGDGAELRVVGGPATSDGVSQRVEQRLLREFLEKGVIRRSRLRGLFVPRADDEAAAAAASAAFAASEPPLTA